MDSPVEVRACPIGKSKETEVSQRKFDFIEDFGEGAPTMVPAFEENRIAISLPELRRPRVLQTRGRCAYGFTVLGCEEYDFRFQITRRLSPDSWCCLWKSNRSLEWSERTSQRNDVIAGMQHAQCWRRTLQWHSLYKVSCPHDTTKPFRIILRKPVQSPGSLLSAEWVVGRFLISAVQGVRLSRRMDKSRRCRVCTSLQWCGTTGKANRRFSADVQSSKRTFPNSGKDQVSWSMVQELFVAFWGSNRTFGSRSSDFTSGFTFPNDSCGERAAGGSGGSGDRWEYHGPTRHIRRVNTKVSFPEETSAKSAAVGDGTPALVAAIDE